MFSLYTVGIKTNRDDVVSDWDRDRLSARIRNFISGYNAEVHRYKEDPTADWPNHLKWSRDLKQDAERGRLAVFDEEKISASVVPPFHHTMLFFDRILNEEILSMGPHYGAYN
ncbi:MAG: hypothetical protein M3Z32_00570 [Acidobacteriota bacterium]|nr:hypothetical protein [Acidobacteriota bacterium]